MAEQTEPELNHRISANLSDSTKSVEPELETSQVTEANTEKQVPRYTERIKGNGYDFELRVYGSAQELRRSAYEYIMRKRLMGK